jgi:hypothetical protein
MASNTTLNAGTGGDVITTKVRTHDGDATKCQSVSLAGVTGTEDSYTFADVAAGGGVEAAALRVTLASDSTGVVSVDDNGSSITVDGTVAVTGVATAANQTTVIGHLDGVEGLLTTIDGDTGALAAAVKAEDAAHSSGDTGFMMLAVRQNSQVDLGADGDYVPPTIDDSGGLRVSIVAGAGSGGTAAADDADFTAGTTQGTPAMGVYESSPTSVTDGDLGTVGITQTRAMKVHVASGGVAGVADDAAVTPGTTEVVMVGATFDDTTPDSVDEGDGGMLRMSANRNLYGTIRDAAGNERGANVNASNALLTVQTGALPAGTNNIGDVDVLTVPADPFGANADAASATGSISAKLRFIAATGIPITGTVTVGSHAVTNAGTFATQVDGSALTALQLIDNASVVDDAAFTPATTGVTVAGFFADETATDSVDEGDAGAARMTLDRKQIVTPYAHAAAGGATPLYNLDVDETEDAVKASAGKLMALHVMNLAATKRYVKFYNATVANVTVGTTTPVLSLPIPTMGDTNGAGFTFPIPSCGIQFDTAITVAATTGFADNDTGAPGANEIIVNLAYI